MLNVYCGRIGNRQLVDWQSLLHQLLLLRCAPFSVRQAVSQPAALSLYLAHLSCLPFFSFIILLLWIYTVNASECCCYCYRFNFFCIFFCCFLSIFECTHQVLIVIAAVVTVFSKLLCCDSCILYFIFVFCILHSRQGIKTLFWEKCMENKWLDFKHFTFVE